MAVVGRRRGTSWVMAAAALAAAAPAAADWLVMRDGARVETKGPWTVQGSMVVFHTPNGTFSAVRLRDADLDASREATEKAKLPPPPAAATPAPKKPAIVITDADLERSEPAPAAGSPAAATSPAAESAAADGTPSAAAAPEPAAAAAEPSVEPAKAERLQISEWHQDLDASRTGVVLVAQVRNTSRDVVGDIQVTAKLLDEGGAVMATAEALLGSTVLRPGQQTVLRASFPGVHTFSDASFETKELALRSFAEAGKS